MVSAKNKNKKIFRNITKRTFPMLLHVVVVVCQLFLHEVVVAVPPCFHLMLVCVVVVA